MIILNCQTGRMSNHKIMQAHVMAAALARGERWLFVGDSWFWRLEATTVGRVWNKCVRMMKPAEGSRNRCFRLSGLTIVHGWTELRDFEAMKKFGDRIREEFNHGKHGVHGRERGKGEVVVGIHKRRGDYRTWQGGKYFYGDEVWERVMKEMEEEIKVKVRGEGEEGVKVRFEVFSDENAVRSAEEDQDLMSQCDYLIGPPSTFTTWASFMGKVPLLHLMSADQTVRLSEFVNRWA